MGGDTAAGERELAEVSFGVPRGEKAPDFTLPCLQGGDARLAGWRGRRLLLLFIQPDCPYSRMILPTLAALPVDPQGDGLLPVIVTAGGAEENRRAMQDYGIRCPVLLQGNCEAAIAYGIKGTPACYVIDEEGRIEQPAGMGAPIVLEYAGVTPSEHVRSAGWGPWTSRYKNAGEELSWLLKTQSVERKRRAGSTCAGWWEREKQPLVSVVLATRDRARFLRIALECYHRQTYPKRELIVVDDGNIAPVDRDAVEAAGGRVVRVEEGTALGSKLNRGVSEARGLLCQKWDDDDWYAPEFLETMVGAMVEQAEARCGPVVVYLLQNYWFDLDRWSVYAVSADNPMGGTLLFARVQWEQVRFRDISNSEDLWFLVDYLREGGFAAPIDVPGIYLMVRHSNIQRELGHTWDRWVTGQRLEEYLRTLSGESLDPSDIFPAWALPLYRAIHDLRAVEILPGIGALGDIAYPSSNSRAPERPSLLFLCPRIPSLIGGDDARRFAMTLMVLAARYRVYLLVVPLGQFPNMPIPAGIAALCEEWAIVRHDLAQEAVSGPPLGTIRVAQAFDDVVFDVVHSCSVSTIRYAEAYVAAQFVRRPSWHLDLCPGESRDLVRRVDYPTPREPEELGKDPAREVYISPPLERVYVHSELDRVQIEARVPDLDVRYVPDAVPAPGVLLPLRLNQVCTFLYVDHHNSAANEPSIRFLIHDILPVLRKRARAPFRIVFVGRGMKSKALQHIAQLPEVDLIGPVAEMGFWYERADAVLVPVQAAGETRTLILEAMTYGRPVVSTAIGCEGLEVRHNEHLLVGDSAEEFAGQSVRLMEEPELAASLSRNAFELCRRAYSPEAVGRALFAPHLTGV